MATLPFAGLIWAGSFDYRAEHSRRARKFISGYVVYFSSDSTKPASPGLAE